MITIFNGALENFEFHQRVDLIGTFLKINVIIIKKGKRK